MSVDNKITWPGWETVQLIGRGSFGAVYEIQRDMFGDIEKAALKVITIPQNNSDIEEMYSDGYDEESITNTFQSHLRSIIAEYSLMRKMNGCTNIVNCDDVRYVQHDDGIGWDIFIKMELLTPLPKALSAEITEELVIKIAKDMCCALELCKKYEIVHRDIKPQNIFVSPNGDYKLGDFGIAKTVEKTMGGTKIGTYKYMAPEVYNNEPYGSVADIYSLGLVLYWLLNERRMPFLPLPPEKLKAGMDEVVRKRRLSGAPIPAAAHGSEGLKQIVLKACAYDVKDRYASASEMLADLNRLGGMVAQESGSQVPVNVVNGSVTNTEQINIETAEDEHTVGVLGVTENGKQENGSDVVAEEMTVGLFGGENSAGMETKKECEEEETIGLFGGMKLAEEEKTVVPKEVETVQKKVNFNTVQKQTAPTENTNKVTTVASKKEIPWTPIKFEEEQEKAVGVSVKKKFPKKFLWGIGGGLIALIVVLVCVFGGMNRGDSETANLAQNSGASATEVSVEPPAPTPITTKVPIVAIATNFEGIAALYEDGTVYVDCWQSKYEYKKTEEWSDIVSVCAGPMHFVGLDKNGKVYTAGWEDHINGKEDEWIEVVDSWTDIVAISAGREFTLGLKADGTVVIAGQHSFDVSDLKDVVSISASQFTAEFLTKEGKWIARGQDPFEVNVSDLVDILSVQNNYSFGVKQNGKVVGVDSFGNVNDMPWENVKEVEAESERVIVLYNDGSVVAYNIGPDLSSVEYNKYGECNVSGWNDIVAIAGDGVDIDGYTVGLKSDGTVVATGMYYNNRVCDVSALNERITKTIIPISN